VAEGGFYVRSATVSDVVKKSFFGGPKTPRQNKTEDWAQPARRVSGQTPNVVPAVCNHRGGCVLKEAKGFRTDAVCVNHGIHALVRTRSVAAVAAVATAGTSGANGVAHAV